MRHLVWKTALMALLLLVAPSAALAQEDDNSMDFTMEDVEGEGDAPRARGPARATPRRAPGRRPSSARDALDRSRHGRGDREPQGG